VTEQVIHPFRPTARLIVKLAEDGVRLVNNPKAPPLFVSFAQLVLISELDATDSVDIDQVISRVVACCGESTENLAQFVRAMRNTERLRRQKYPVPARAVAVLPGPVNSTAVELESGLLGLKLPLLPRLHGGKFQFLDHDARLIVDLSPAELMAVSEFLRPVAFAAGYQAHQQALLGQAITESSLKAILGSFASAGLLYQIEGEQAGNAAQLAPVPRADIFRQNFARQAAEQDEREAQRQKETGVYRPKVIPVCISECVPAALGLIYAYAKTIGNGFLDEFYDFRLDWFWDDERLEAFTAKPAVYLFSNYLWSHEQNIVVSETVKQRSPGSITIHGGPDTPKYAEDALKYFATYPHVDIIVRGEGEASAAEVLDKLRSVIGQENPDLSVLKGVAGVSYRSGGEIIRNPDRPRIEDLDTIPSPYLMGLFDAYIGAPRLHVTLETNRGCPYGCTFCDWGSATTSKIRKFDLDRVFDDLEWCSRAKVESVSQADANFGVFERDVSIAEKVAELKRTTGYPEIFGGSYAKNSTKYLKKIIKVLAEENILTQGVLSLQTMDDNTLSVIKRSNIKVEKYDALADEMRKSKLQLSVELMMGLPGSSLKSFIDDLQQCIDRNIQARINHTTMLINSPMNNPAYRAEHQIETATELLPGKLAALVSTRTYTRDDLKVMLALRQIYILFDNFGVLRLCSHFVRQQTGMQEMEFYYLLYKKAGEEASRASWPVLCMQVTMSDQLMAAPYSWALLMEDLRGFLVTECGVPDDSALDSILTAQRAVLPTHGRTFPCSVELQHDVVGWHDQMLTAKAAGFRRDWQTVVPPLLSFGPARFEVDDPGSEVTKTLGCDIEVSHLGVNWDMVSGIGRARVALDFVPPWDAESTETIVKVG
jgi:radical SAM superfamily enzyme YgiQ (UPF0313 family)